MRTIERSTDRSLRPSPSISATVYPKGYRMRGNDGNLWEIIIDSRGVHRWQKVRGYTSEGLRNYEEFKDRLKQVVKESDNATQFEEKLQADLSPYLDMYFNQARRDILEVSDEDYAQMRSDMDFDKLDQVSWKGMYEKMASKSVLKNVNKQIEGMKVLLEDDPSLRDSIKKKLEKRIEGYQLLIEDDAEYEPAILALKKFLRESFRYGGRVQQLEKKANLYQNVLQNTDSRIAKEFLTKRLHQINEQKKFVYA